MRAQFLHIHNVTLAIFFHICSRILYHHLQLASSSACAFLINYLIQFLTNDACFQVSVEPFILKSQLYSSVKDRTQVDRELEVCLGI